MDHELRTDAASDPSIKHLSLSADTNNIENETNDDDQEILSNLLNSLEAQVGWSSIQMKKITTSMIIVTKDFINS